MQAIGEIRVPTLELEARFAASTLNADDRTVEVVWTTGARVPKVRYRGYDREEYDEELLVTPEAVDLRRLNAGAPVLDNHRQWGSVRDTLGVVVRAWIQDGEGRALLKFKDNEAAREILRDIRDEILGAVSVGYRVHEYEDITGDASDARRTLRATKWEVYEMSLVFIPADIESGTRSAADELRTVPIYAQRAPEARGADMDDDQTTDAGNTPAATTTTTTTEQRSAPAPATPPAPEPTSTRSDVDVEAVRREGAAAERERQTQIRSACAKAGVGGGKLEQRLLDNGVTIEEARAQIIDGLAAADEETSTRSGSGIEIGAEHYDKVRTAVENALESRASNGSVELTESGREMMGMPILEMGRRMLEASGERALGMGRVQLASRLLSRAHSTSDFPNILANIGNNTLRRAYDELQPSWAPFVRRTSNPDFKTATRAQISAAPGLKKKVEGAPFKTGSMTDAAEPTKVETHGVIVPVTREAIINDDLGAFQRVVPSQAMRVRELEADLVYGVLTANAAMADGNNLFSAAHSNTGTGVIGDAGLKQAWEKIRVQKGLSDERLGLMLATIIVPTGLRIDAEKYLNANLVPAKASDANPFRRMNLTLVDDPRLDDASPTQWYGAAGLAQIDLIELVYLEQDMGPRFEERESFHTEGLEFKVALDVAGHAIDFRGLYRSSGS